VQPNREADFKRKDKDGKKNSGKDANELDERKRKYNSNKHDDDKISSAEMEEYKLKRMKFEDPLRSKRK